MEKAPVILNSHVPQLGERALIVGQTGSGKTIFAIWLLERIPFAPIFIYDTKIEPKFEALPKSVVVETLEQASVAYLDVTKDYIIIRPPIELMDKPEELDKYLLYHYHHFHHSCAYIDEGYTFHSNSRAYPGIIALMTRGRSKGITTILSSQRPRGVSRFLISESQKFYIFRLQDKDDRKRIADVIPNFHNLEQPPKHSFYYFESGDDNPVLFSPIKVDKKFEQGYVDKQVEQGETSGEKLPEVAPHIWV
jgi:hypothetical protein